MPRQTEHPAHLDQDNDDPQVPDKCAATACMQALNAEESHHALRLLCGAAGLPKDCLDSNATSVEDPPNDTASDCTCIVPSQPQADPRCCCGDVRNQNDRLQGTRPACRVHQALLCSR